MSNTPAIAGTDQRAMVSDALLQKALAGRTPEQITALIGETAVSAIVAAQTPPVTPAASEDAGDKPKKMKGKGKKDKMESEDAEYDDEDEMEASAADTAPLATAAEIGNAFMAVFPSASASQILACISITDRAKAAAPAVASEPDEGTAELAALIKHNATNLDAGGGEAPKAKNHGWEDIHAEVRQLRGH